MLKLIGLPPSARAVGVKEYGWPTTTCVAGEPLIVGAEPEPADPVPDVAGPEPAVEDPEPEVADPEPDDVGPAPDVADPGPGVAGDVTDVADSVPDADDGVSTIAELIFPPHPANERRMAAHIEKSIELLLRTLNTIRSLLGRCSGAAVVPNTEISATETAETAITDPV